MSTAFFWIFVLLLAMFLSLNRWVNNNNFIILHYFYKKAFVVNFLLKFINESIFVFKGK